MIDWHDDPDLTRESQANLNALEDLREDDLILWAMVLGLRTSRSIARWIARPHDWVLLQLRRHKADSLVFDDEGRKSVVWEFHMMHEHAQDLAELRAWVARERREGGIFNPVDAENENEG